MREAIRALVCVAAAILFSCRVQAASGQVSVSLPLEGHYRPGRFMPVRVSTSAGPNRIELGAVGAVPSELDDPADRETIVPILVVSDSARELQVAGEPGVPIKALDDRQRLIAFAGADAELAKPLFPDCRIVPIGLDVNRALLEPPQAWSGVDAVVLSPGARARIDDDQMRVLLAAGVTFIVKADREPDERWPWRRLGNDWVLQHRVAGPVDMLSPEAYSPTYVWDRGLPAAMRRQIILGAVTFCIFAVGVSLWRPRRAMAIFVALCVLAGGAVFGLYLRQPPELRMNGAVVVRGTELTQRDDWTWQSPLGDALLWQTAQGLTLPVFASDRQIEQSGIRLECDSSGRPMRFSFRLGRDQSLAFVTRSVERTTPMKAIGPIGGVWKDFAADLYARPGDEVLGEAASNTAGASPIAVVNRADGR